MALQRSRVLLNRHKFAGSDIAFRIPVMSSKFQDKKAAANFLQQCIERSGLARDIQEKSSAAKRFYIKPTKRRQAEERRVMRLQRNARLKLQIQRMLYAKNKGESGPLIPEIGNFRLP